MDFGKLQVAVLKNIYKYIDNTAARDYIVYSDTIINKKLYTPIAYKKSVIYLVPYSVSLLNQNLQRISYNIELLFEHITDSAELRYMDITLDYHKTRLKLLESPNSERIWVDTKLLTAFGTDIKFYYSEKNEAAIYIKDGSGELLGVVMRVRLSEDIDNEI